MHDRLAAVGGRLLVESRRGGGAVVRGLFESDGARVFVTSCRFRSTDARYARLMGLGERP